MKNINLRSFTLDELQTNLPEDCFLECGYEGIDKKATKFEMADYFDASIRQGSENLYFEITAYYDGFRERKIAIYSKDNRDKLMEWISELLKEVIY